MALHPDGRRVALATEKTILLVDLDLASSEAPAPRPQVRELEGHGDSVCVLTWLPDGSRLVSGSRDRTVRVWHAEHGTCLATLRGHDRVIASVAVSPGGKRIAAGGEDGSVRVWEAGQR